MARLRSTLLLREVMDEFMATGDRRGFSPGTVRQYKQTFNTLLAVVGVDKLASSLSRHDMDTHFYTREVTVRGKRIRASRADALSPSTFNKELCQIGLLIKFGSSGGRNYFQPFLMENASKRTIIERQKLWLTANELQFVLEDQEHPRDRMLIATGIFTALRANEIAAATISDVNLQTGRFRATMSKNNKVDVLPMTEELASETRKWLTFYTEAVGPLEGYYLLVPSKEKTTKRSDVNGRFEPDVHAPLRPTMSSLLHMQDPVKASIAKLGYPTRQEGMHTIRRSAARMFYDLFILEGKPNALRLVMTLLNHSSEKMTETYIGIRRERVERDELMLGLPSLSRMINRENVVAFPKRAAGVG